MMLNMCITQPIKNTCTISELLVSGNCAIA